MVVFRNEIPEELITSVRNFPGSINTSNLTHQGTILSCTEATSKRHVQFQTTGLLADVALSEIKVGLTTACGSTAGSVSARWVLLRFDCQQRCSSAGSAKSGTPKSTNALGLGRSPPPQENPRPAPVELLVCTRRPRTPARSKPAPARLGSRVPF